jgi:heme iron utilization protein
MKQSSKEYHCVSVVSASAFSGAEIMDQATLGSLSKLIRSRRLASLGTLRDGRPFVSMVLVVPAHDGAAFYMLASRLAWHTQDILKDPHVSLMLTEPESPDRDPQTLARLSITGEATIVDREDSTYNNVHDLYLSAFPSSAQYFQLGDFELFRITPRGGRFVGGFARAFTITIEDLKRACQA